MEVEEFKVYVKKLHEAQQCLGNDDFDRPKLEKQNKKILPEQLLFAMTVLAHVPPPTPPRSSRLSTPATGVYVHHPEN